ncbi:bifunctional ADP-dependent NAD(P)H-hydrate dehydratase/NAD(P)H-hydrate epimerase [Acaricomes phytoseiuli]|uniref:bifunctional ADP-dependent NAD(P)H-hydrate dehydratase/NAD(P)H-hydrate epimerase n=1 Tax=Acaricomes phytoseiuli TaxID=291968 RepID=UPI0003620258|nr:bifunctional ADP-dependent NAD(P)H-hydrate dehydratase/NAD(P)H-hydrate epimerase [Acaricomes phytoseiuli]MCW1250240.1 bifunctional ADP-dependent NAD(P)H-hydrate dehydratase/NAD(P)H-hydrate epimerase [Acaricomes phytoseiuli]
MIPGYTGTAVRAAEEALFDAGQGEDLMPRAAYGLANAAIWRLTRDTGAYGRRVLLLVGSGNNGGDALYAGALLARRGVAVTATQTRENIHEEALAAFRQAGGRLLRLTEHNITECLVSGWEADLVIDGILGTGARGGLTGPAAELVRGLDAHPGVLACDLPSGLNADTGETTGPVLHAVETVTFGGIKAGLFLPPGEAAAGAVSLVDLGLALNEPELLRLGEADINAHWPRPVPTDHKYSRGVLGVVAGSAVYPGAAQLAVAGALAAGVGMVRYLGPDQTSVQMPAEVVAGVPAVEENRVQAWLVGSGVVDDPGQEERTAAAIRSGLPVVIDAGALALVPEEASPSMILTPHAGELATLLSRRGRATSRTEVEAEPLRYARLSVEMTGATVLLKGSTTIIVSPEGPVYSQSEGTPWLATAGSGDTLAGILGALLASGVEPALAAALAASVHGRAGSAASQGGPITAGDIASALPGVLTRLLRGEC